MNTTLRALAANVLGQTLRPAVGIAVLGMLGWAVIAAPGCESTHGKYTKEHMSTAKAKMEALKSATEYKMAEQAFLGNDLPKALKHVEYSISLNEPVAKSHVLLGRIKMEMGDVEAAQAAFEDAKTLDAKSVDAEYYEGILAERIDRKEDALAHYQAAVALDPAKAQYAIATAEMMIELGKVPEAQTFLESRQAAFDHNSGVRQTLGHIAMMKNEPTQAESLFNEAHLLTPDDQGITEDLIRAQIATRKFAEAEYNLSRILTGKENKDRRDLIHMRAACLIQLDRPVEARDILVKLTQDQAGAADIEAWISLGQVSYTLNDMVRVRLASGRIIAIAPQRPEGYILKALALRRAGDLDGAKKNVQTALTLQSTADEYVLLGMIQQDQARTNDARLSYAAALRQDPKNETAGKLLNALDHHVE
jgi:tetratricopeptide (TPR) repeat protein